MDAPHDRHGKTAKQIQTQGNKTIPNKAVKLSARQRKTSDSKAGRNVMSKRSTNNMPHHCGKQATNKKKMETRSQA
jgi:hypothetical protein